MSSAGKARIIRLGRTLRLVMRRRFRAMLRLPISWPKGSAVDSRFLTRPDERLGQIQILHQQRGNCFSAWTVPRRDPIRESCAASPGRQASNGDLAVAHHEPTGRFGPAPLAGPKRVRCARFPKSAQTRFGRAPTGEERDPPAGPKRVRCARFPKSAQTRYGRAPTGEERDPPAGPKRVRCARFLRSVAPG